MATTSSTFNAVSVKFIPTPGAGRRICGSPILPHIRQATENIYNRANSICPTKWADMDNDNFYHHAIIDSKGFARGDVECGNLSSMYYNKRDNILLKALRG